MDGILLVNKPKGITSRDVVNEISKFLKTKKVGHTGTLDPIATGVLALCIGKYTKLSDELTSTKKEYIATAIVGQDSDTLDNTGIITKDETQIIEKEKIEQTIKSFEKIYDQEVPSYSAVKINGKKLYEYARNNEKVDLPTRKVEIYEIELLDVKYEENHTIIKFRCLVSKGTYIRSLIRDIGKSLNTCAIMSDLIRTKQGNFNIEESYTIEQIKNNDYKFIDIYNYLEEYEKIIMDDELKNKIDNGAIYLIYIRMKQWLFLIKIMNYVRFIKYMKKIVKKSNQ